MKCINPRKLFIVLIILPLPFLQNSCDFFGWNSENHDTLRYLFAGHLYEWYKRDQADSRLVELDKSGFDQQWYGGDFLSHTTEKQSNLTYLENNFHISDSSVHWSLGNHDVLEGPAEWITNATKKDLFYAYYTNGITVINFCSILSNIYENDPEGYCSNSTKQLEMVQNVFDTIEKSSHLIFFTHNILWYNIDPDAKRYSNLAKTDFIACDTTKTFDELIYPSLIDLTKKNIKVICLGGDSGLWGKKGQHLDDNGIAFIVNGLNNSKLKDRHVRKTLEKYYEADAILILSHYLYNDSMSWEFHNLDTLVHEQKLRAEKEAVHKVEL